MSGLITAAFLALAALVWIWVGRVEDPEEELEMLGGRDSARLVEAEMRKSPGLSRREAAKRVLRELRRDSS